MNVTVFGSGYVGLVAGACFAESGNQVYCADVDPEKIEMLNQGGIPIYEPGLKEMVIKNHHQKRLHFTTDLALATRASDICFIAVGTPPDEDGSADLQYVLSVAKTIATYMETEKVIVDKSTVPVGTADHVKRVVSEVLAQRGVDLPFHVVSNPEFLKEGAAIDDFMDPDRVVIGVDSMRAEEVMKELYLPFTEPKDCLIRMDIKSAEMTKYAANSMLATKISFMNEMAALCEKVGANIDQVRVGIGADSRIGHHFLYPGVGYGGSCFPKDVQALVKTGKKNGVDLEILSAVESVNARQKQKLFHRVLEYFGGQLEGKKLAIWGLAFKPKTDDMREAPSLVILEGLVQKGAHVVAYDPEAIEETRRIVNAGPSQYPQFSGFESQIHFEQHGYDALKQADALLILTEWSEFRRPDFALMKSLLKAPLIFDGRNIYEPSQMALRGFEYHSIGRPSVKANETA